MKDAHCHLRRHCKYINMEIRVKYTDGRHFTQGSIILTNEGKEVRGLLFAYLNLGASAQ